MMHLLRTLAQKQTANIPKTFQPVFLFLALRIMILQKIIHGNYSIKNLGLDQKGDGERGKQMKWS